jgi:N-acetyl-gamma-glutamyl-phosphate reductase
VQDTSGQNVNVSIIGASGYTGAELLRLLLFHPKVNVRTITSRQFEGKSLKEVLPQFAGTKFENLRFESLNIKDISNNSDIIFCCLPHAASFPIVKDISQSGNAKVIDFSADFRFKNLDIYERTYKVKHTAKELLKESSYGLPEMNREEIRESRIVANPGCYPTSIILALLPAVREGIISESYPVIADSKSGVTGAGRKAKVELLFCEVNESLKAYSIGKHRHAPEIAEKLGINNLQFTPHLVPMSRGILSTVYFKTSTGIDNLKEIYQEFYRKEPFVRMRETAPSTSDVRGTNYCDIFVTKNENTGLATIISVIDNIGKGASGQAVQNMNIICGFEETLGLELPPLWP